jgi:hypothetical protein
MNPTEQQDECCKLFNPCKWDEQEHEWRDKQFIKSSLPQFFHFPLPGTYGKTIGKLWKMAEETNAAPPMEDFLLLAYDPSPWKSDIYLNVIKDVPGADNVRLSGKFISKVFDGPFNKVPQYIRDMDIYLANRHMLALKYYIYFASCPKCAKKYGHNYIVAFAEV